MPQDKKPQKRWANKHFWYSLMPLLITLLAIILINWAWPNTVAEPSPTRLRTTAVSLQPNTSSITTTRPPILLATILPSPTPTITPLPELTNSAAITLLGPPPESNVAIDGRLAFYWTYSEPLLPGQQFVLSLRQDGTIISTQTVAATNLGDGFQASLHLADLALAPGTAVWQVHLEWDDGQQLLAGEERAIVLLPE